MPNNERLIIRISSSIKCKLSELSDSSSEQCIFKVHDRLRNHNKEAYEPQVLSIGPYHHGKCNLKKMETHKPRYLQKLLHRKGEENADTYINALMKLKDRARLCYAEEISLSENDFVEMLCLDGIFIIEFLRKKSGKLPHGDDIIFKMDWLISTIERDLILFENQIPFFVLAKLFDMTKPDDGEDSNLINLALSVCQLPFDIDPNGSSNSISAEEVIHLLDLWHKGSCSSFDERLEISDHENDEKSWCSYFDAILKKITGVKPKDVQKNSLPELKSTGQLQQSGIKFERAQPHTPWFHITFENGILKIPHLTVEDHTESKFRNLIAFEQYMTDSQRQKIVTAYVWFLDDLINSQGDVEKLCRYGILTNYLGDDEFVATMFNKLVRDVSPGDFYYIEVRNKVNKHANGRWNIWKAHLMTNYFNTPWSVISFLAAVVLLILTFVQTTFSILAA